MLGNDQKAAKWISDRISYLRGESLGECTTFTVANDAGTKILGAVAFHNYRPEYRSIDWTAAADSANWLSPRIITQIMRYPFEQLECRRITSFVAQDNIRSRQFQLRFGFKQEGKLRRYFGSQDCVIFGLLRSDWKRSPFNVNRVVPTVEAEQPAMMVN